MLRPAPLFASQISHKYAQLNARAGQTDLEQKRGREVATSAGKEKYWASELPVIAGGNDTVVAILDDAMIPMSPTVTGGVVRSSAPCRSTAMTASASTPFTSPARPSTANTLYVVHIVNIPTVKLVVPMGLFCFNRVR